MKGAPIMNHQRCRPWGLGAAMAVAAAVVLAGCGGSPSKGPLAVTTPRTSASAATPRVTSPLPAPPSSGTTPPAVAVTPSPAPATASRHHSVSTTPSPRPTSTTTPVPAPSGPAPATPGTYHYRQAGTLVGTPAQGTLVVAPVSASGTQVWTRVVGGTLPPASSVMLFNATGSYLVSPASLVTGTNASCTFAAPVPWPSWPTTTGSTFSAPANCTGGVTTYQLTGRVDGTAAMSLNGQAVTTAVVVNTFVVKGDVNGDTFNVTLIETDYFAPTLRVPVLTRTQIKGSAIGIPISTSRTDTLESATPS